MCTATVFSLRWNTFEQCYRKVGNHCCWPETATIPLLWLWSLKGPWSSVDLTLRTVAPCFLSDHSVTSSGPQRHWALALSVLLPLHASERARAHLNALLTTKDVPVDMELLACGLHRLVYSTVNTGKHSSDTEAQGHAQPCLRHRHTGRS